MENLMMVNNYHPTFAMSNPVLSQEILKGKSILFVDDEYVNYLYFAELLSETGATIIRAFSYEQIKARIVSEQQICLMMIAATAIQGMSEQIITQIRQIAPDLPIIGILEHDFNEALDPFLTSGCDLYLNRYVDTLHLIEIIDELLAGSFGR